MKSIRIELFLIGIMASPQFGWSDPASAGGASREVAAIIQNRCGKCHGEKNPKGRLTLTTPAGLARGGKKGLVLRPGKPDESRLWQMVESGDMPPDEPLPPTERQVLRQWIATGAPGLPAGVAATHWAFRTPQRPAVPASKLAGLRTAIDCYIAAALEPRNLELRPEVDRPTLARRVAYDLTGLPPTPAEVDAFLADTSHDAYERMVKRYLASPHYGERWGKFWLDAAGYADSNGYFNADSDRPLAYKYRDYVIRSFNADKPFDDFVREQLAGDELAGYTPDGDVTPKIAELLTATHLLRNAPDGTGESDGNPDEVRTDRYTVLEGNLQIVMNTLLGITIQCARCHDHKFEPVSHAEYYQLQAILFPAYCPDRWVRPAERTVEVASRTRREEHHRLIERVDRQVQALQAGLAIQAGPFRESLAEERLHNLDPHVRDSVLLALRTPKEKLTADQKALLQKHVEPLKLTEDELAKRFPEFSALRDVVRRAVAEREKLRPAPLERLSVLVDGPGPLPIHHVLLRGQHNKPGDPVAPGVPVALCTPGNIYAATTLSADRGTARRLALARWLTAPANPLFARVFVNRVWQQHFGKGLVALPDNFGVSGPRPSHPELLDWLAVEFMDSGFSVKNLHRLILGSAVYRQSSRVPSATEHAAQAFDPDNRLLWRFPLRRHDAEALRDAMLAVAGELDRRPGGPYVPTGRSTEGNVEVDEARPGARRRSVYLQQRRTQVATFLDLFDAPSIVGSCSARNTTTVPLQALALLNSDFARRRAAAFADRLRRQSHGGSTAPLTQAFCLAFGRPPFDNERLAALRFLEGQRQVYSSQKDAETKAWVDLCQMLMASNAFLYVE